MKTLLFLMVVGLLSLAPRVSKAHHTEADCPTIFTSCLSQQWVQEQGVESCQRFVRPNGTACRQESNCENAGVCSLGSCIGVSGLPRFKPSTTPCDLEVFDFLPGARACNDATCSGFSTICVSHPKQNGATCRPSASGCDRPERCAELGFPVLECPDDVQQPVNTLCRSATNGCDVVEVCDGASFDCPADEVAPDSTLCRAAVDTCDVSDFCDGETKTCPDVVAEAGTLCRDSEGDCDAEETCDGIETACPEDSPADDTTACDDGDECTDGDACTQGQCIGDGIDNCPAVDVDAGPTTVADAGVDGADGGMVNSDAGPGEAGSDAGAGPEDEKDGGCGCSSSNPNNPSSPFALLLVLVVLGYFRRQIFSTRN